MKKNIVKIVTTLAVVALLVAMLVACVPTDYKKAAKNLEEADYIVSVDDNEDFLWAVEEMGLKDVEHIIYAYKMDENTDEFIMLYYFKNTSSAKESLDKIKEDAGDGDDYVLKRSGKLVYVGTEQATKDAK